MRPKTKQRVNDTQMLKNAIPVHVGLEICTFFSYSSIKMHEDLFLLMSTCRIIECEICMVGMIHDISF